MPHDVQHIMSDDFSSFVLILKEYIDEYHHGGTTTTTIYPLSLLLACDNFSGVVAKDTATTGGLQAAGGCF